MGEQRKKVNGRHFGILMILLIFACFTMLVGSSLVVFERVIKTTVDLTTCSGDFDRYWLDYGPNFFARQEDKVCYITSPGQLIRMYNMLSSTDDDYSGYTFVLENDIDLGKYMNNTNSVYVHPFWLPVDNKHQNVSFYGNGHTITGMNIKFDDDVPRNVGFFANLVGGVIKDVNFENPKIIYNYSGSNSENLTDICLGIVVGEADSTYVHNVNIINPIIEFTADNISNHNFYIGTAVGKLSFTTVLNAENEVNSINTVSPKQWGLDTVNVYGNGSESEINITIAQGAEILGSTYGNETYGYFGGLVGANISSKIINSTLKDFALRPIIDTTEIVGNVVEDIHTQGEYYVGGAAGLSTQVVTARMVAAGLYNNLLLNVNLADVADVSGRYLGNFVGRVCSGSWVYNNLVIGHMPYSKLWGEISNSDVSVLYGTESEMQKYNFYFEAVDNSNYQGSSYYKFIDPNYLPKFYTPIGEDDGFTQFQLMNFVGYDYLQDSNFDSSLYHAALPIIKYENGLTINGVSAEVYAAMTDEQKYLEDKQEYFEAIYQFREWGDDRGNIPEPVLKDTIGMTYQGEYVVTFIADYYQNNLLSEAYFEELEYGYLENRVGQKTVKYDYLNFIIEPEEPKCEGYEFLGWKIKGWDTGANLSPYASYLDNGFYQFGHERITDKERTFVAIWKKKSFKATYYLPKYDVKGNYLGADLFEDETLDYDAVANKRSIEVKEFGNPLFGPRNTPISEYGFEFAGWYLDTPPTYGKADQDETEPWKVGLGGNVMPGRNIALYAGWIDHSSELKQMLLDYRDYRLNYKVYFEDETGRAFKVAYDEALNADISTANLDKKNLSEAINNLRVEPTKMKNLAAFDETLKENSCPFLYMSDYYHDYQNKKESASIYIDAEVDDEIRKNVKGYVTLYNQLNDYFNGLKNKLKSSVEDAGGVDSTIIQDLIAKYQTLEKRYEELIKEDKYDLTNLEEAENTAYEVWTGVNANSSLAEVINVIANYESAFNNIQPKNIEDTNHSSQNSFQLGISPVLLGIIVIFVLGAGVGGYIGIDFILLKRRFGWQPKNKNVKPKQVQQEEIQEPEEDTYV